MKKFLYYLFLVILGLILCMNVLSVIGSSLFGVRLFKIGSGSMEPEYNINDLVIVKKSKDYKVGDVITFQGNQNEYVTHRIIRIENGMIVTKGDSNNTEDDPINEDMILGKVVFSFKSISAVSHYLAKPVVWLILFLTGVLVAIFKPLDTEERSLKDEKTDKEENKVNNEEKESSKKTSAKSNSQKGSKKKTTTNKGKKRKTTTKKHK